MMFRFLSQKDAEEIMGDVKKTAAQKEEFTEKDCGNGVEKT